MSLDVGVDGRLTSLVAMRIIDVSTICVNYEKKVKNVSLSFFKISKQSN